MKRNRLMSSESMEADLVTTEICVGGNWNRLSLGCSFCPNAVQITHETCGGPEVNVPQWKKNYQGLILDGAMIFFLLAKVPLKPVSASNWSVSDIVEWFSHCCPWSLRPSAQLNSNPLLKDKTMLMLFFLCASCFMAEIRGCLTMIMFLLQQRKYSWTFHWIFIRMSILKLIMGQDRVNMESN